jgi:hypothetical protein
LVLAKRLDGHHGGAADADGPVAEHEQRSPRLRCHPSSPLLIRTSG